MANHAASATSLRFASCKHFSILRFLPYCIFIDCVSALGDIVGKLALTSKDPLALKTRKEGTKAPALGERQKNVFLLTAELL